MSDVRCWPAVLTFCLAPLSASIEPAAARFDPALHLTAEAGKAACSALRDGGDEACFASVALFFQNPEACSAAGRPAECHRLAVDRGLEQCSSFDAQIDQQKCFLLLGTELGAVLACQRLLNLGDRTVCFGSAAIHTNDPQVVVQHVGQPEARNIALGLYVTRTRDLAAIDLFEDARARDGARIMVILPLAILEDRQLPDDWCDQIATSYDGEYGENDAQVNRDVCNEALARARAWSRLELDEQREAFLADLVEESERLDEELAAEEAMSDPFEPFDEAGLQRPRAIDEEGDGEEEDLPFFTGQENRLAVEVWNGTLLTLRRVEISLDGDSSWLEDLQITPTEFEVPSAGKQMLEITFTVAEDAPEGTRAKIVITADSGRSDVTASSVPVAEVSIVLRRRTLNVEIEPKRRAPQ